MLNPIRERRQQALAKPGYLRDVLIEDRVKRSTGTRRWSESAPR